MNRGTIYRPHEWDIYERRTMAPFFKLQHKESENAHTPKRDGGIKMEFFIVIPNWVIPSVNKIICGNKYATSRLKSGATQMIMAYSQHIPKATGRRKVIISHNQSRGRLPDPNNLLKVCHDSLKTLRLILDDSTSKLDFEKPRVNYGVKQTIITIMEVPFV